MPVLRRVFTLSQQGQNWSDFVAYLITLSPTPPPLSSFYCKQRSNCNSTGLSQGCRRPFFAFNRPRIRVNFFLRPDLRFYCLVNREEADAVSGHTPCLA